MAIIKLKKGSGVPSGLTLAEPAFDLSNNRLYLGLTASSVWVGGEVDNSTSLGTSQVKIPTQFAVKTYVDNLGLSPGVLVTSLNGATGAVTLGVTGGPGLSIVNPTGTNKGITLINTGVLSINGNTGAITNVAVTNANNSFSVQQTFSSGINVNGGATVANYLKITGSVTDPGGYIELWDENNTYRKTLRPESTTAKNGTFQFGGADGFVVAANTDGATSGWVVTGIGGGNSPIWVDPSSAVNGIVALRANHISGGVAGSLPYNQAANATTFLGIGSATQILRVNAAANAPEWISPNSAGFTAFQATRALNLEGGVAGSLPYNTAANTTTFVSIGSNATILRSTGTAPAWFDANSAGFTAFTSTNSVMAEDTTDTLSYITFVNNATATNQALKYRSTLTYNAITNFLEANIDGGAF